MNVQPAGAHIPDYILRDAVPFTFVLVILALVVVPAVTFGIARKWAQSQPDIATAVLSGAVIVSVVAILSTAFVALAVMGWIPPLDQLVRRS